MKKFQKIVPLLVFSLFVSFTYVAYWLDKQQALNNLDLSMLQGEISQLRAELSDTAIKQSKKFNSSHEELLGLRSKIESSNLLKSISKQESRMDVIQGQLNDFMETNKEIFSEHFASTLAGRFLKMKFKKLFAYTNSPLSTDTSSDTDFGAISPSLSLATDQIISDTEPYFLECLRNRVDWQLFKNEISSNSESTMKSQFTQILSDFVKIEPLSPINSSCKPHPIQSICSDYPDVFAGERVSPARVAHMIQIGNDLDTLEIHLHEIFDFTDRIFIIESTVSHKDKQSKSLQFENVKFTERFSKFKSKIIHFIIDDADIQFANMMMKNIYPNVSDGWAVEFLQELLRWVKFLEWNFHSRYFGPDDIIGFGDTDEIANRDNMFLLKHCSLQSNVGAIDIGVTMIVGSVNRVFKSDFPVGGEKYPYSYGDPTFFRLSNAMSSVNIPTRMRGKSPHYLLGGVHMTEYEFLPFLLLKRTFCTECGITLGMVNQVQWSLNNLTTLKDLIHPMSIKSGFSGRFSKAASVMENISPHYRLPWFLECNTHRFPSWHDMDNLDSRLSAPRSKFSYKC